MAQTGSREIRGVWLTYDDSNVLESANNINVGLKALKGLGFNTIYPVVWHSGFTLYPSDVAKNFVGSSIIPNAVFEKDSLGNPRDMLAELVSAAKAHGIRVIPWFEFGLMAPPQSDLATRHPDLLMKDAKGSTIRLKSHDKDSSGHPKPDDYVWLNPCHPEVQIFMAELIADVAERYEVDGIQLDDHFGMPVEMSYDSFTEKLYKQETGESNPASNPARWTEWRMRVVDELLAKIFRAVKAKRNSCIISISPNPLKFSQDFYLADWNKWCQAGFAEELIVQVYRSAMSSFTTELSKPELADSISHIPTSIGILTGLKGYSVNFSLIHQQLQETRARGFSGMSFFFYETLLNQELTPLTPRNQSELDNLFA